MVLILPILSGLFNATFDTLTKSIVSKKYSSTNYIFLYNFFACIFALPFLLFNFKLSYQITAWIGIILVILCYIGSNLSVVTAYKYEHISNITIVRQIGLVLSFIFGVIFYRETINIYKIFGVIIIILGLFIIFFEKEKFKLLNYKGLIFALATGLFTALAATLAKYVLDYFNPYVFIFLVYLGLSLSMFLINKDKRQIRELFVKTKYQTALIGLAGVFSFFLLIVAINKYPLSITYITISAVSTISSIGAGILFLRERQKLIHKFGGFLFVFIGIILLYQ